MQGDFPPKTINKLSPIVELLEKNNVPASLENHCVVWLIFIDFRILKNN